MTALCLLNSTLPASAGGDSPPGPSTAPVTDELSVVIGEPSLTPEQATASRAKDLEAGRHIAGRSARIERAASSGKRAYATCGTSTCAYATVDKITQTVQSTSYNCGPATLVSLLRAKGISLSQGDKNQAAGTAAAKLGTTSSGTAWYDGVRYPMASALNSYTKAYGFTYVPQALPYTPTAADKASYKSRLVSNIDKGYGIAGNAYEVPYGPHLEGHPKAMTIHHWFAIRGYDTNGALTKYADSASGAPTISWGAAVPKYWSMDSATIVTIMGERGYVW